VLDRLVNVTTSKTSIAAAFATGSGAETTGASMKLNMALSVKPRMASRR
jgi:hypothetical protein